MPSLDLNFPISVGATTLYALPGRQPVKFFMIDAKIPLYTMFVGDKKFFANAEQAAMVIDQLERASDAPFELPSWKWEFDGGFDKSIDGRGAKGWQLVDPGLDFQTV